MFVLVGFVLSESETYLAEKSLELVVHYSVILGYVKRRSVQLFGLSFLRSQNTVMEHQMKCKDISGVDFSGKITAHHCYLLRIAHMNSDGDYGLINVFTAT